MMRLKNKVTIVTGAASGFGKAIATRFVQEGATVVVADINGDGAKQVAAELGELATAFTCDVSRKVDVEVSRDRCDRDDRRLHWRAGHGRESPAFSGHHPARPLLRTG